MLDTQGRIPYSQRPKKQVLTTSLPLTNPNNQIVAPFSFFEWEREWRCGGQFSFESEDTAFLLIPEEPHAAARWFFEDCLYEHLGLPICAPLLILLEIENGFSKR